MQLKGKLSYDLPGDAQEVQAGVQAQELLEVQLERECSGLTHPPQGLFLPNPQQKFWWRVAGHTLWSCS